ncbi:MAG TPA: DUF3857 and transglutaminase domain-containing protein [Gammaproteobacteria bacterium]|nr:DUF3857 and transglutaminase domain-containing protein [Gammaproteobacteria bacterium]
MLRRFLLVLILLCNSSSVFARWATFADAPAEVLDSRMLINVNADGTCDIDIFKTMKILNERGRDANSKVALVYNADNSKLQIIAAKTILDGKEYAVNQDLIEDKPLASEVQGFDQTHQVLLAFPNVKVGAELSLHYKLNILKADVPNFFEHMFEYDQSYLKKSQVHIKSALPLFTNVNDPQHYLAVTPGKEGKLYTLDITLQKPIYVHIVDEKAAPLNPQAYPWVFVATNDNWQQFAQTFASAYLNVANQTLPPMYQHIADDVKAEKDPIKQIALVAAQINDHVQYMGDWKTTDGKHIPKNLISVATTKLGDCKDFATGMVAILRTLGYDANVALVQRGEGVYDTKDVKLPGMFHFNHAMVRVQLADKRVLWVDPTNFFSVADQILPDIADRQAVVLASPSYLTQIPQSNVHDNVITVHKTFDLKNEDIVSVKTILTMQGLSAIDLTGANLQASQDTINNAVVYQLGDYDNITEKRVKAPKLDSRLVKDITFEVDYKEKNMLINTNAGKAFVIKNPVIENFFFNDEQVADIYLGSPKTIHKSVTLTNIQLADNDVLDYTLQSPWVDIIRTVKYKANSVTVDQKVIIKTSWLNNDTIKSPQYRAFAAELAKNFKEGVAIVFNK